MSRLLLALELTLPPARPMDSQPYLKLVEVVTKHR